MVQKSTINEIKEENKREARLERITSSIVLDRNIYNQL